MCWRVSIAEGNNFGYFCVIIQDSIRYFNV